MEEESFPLKYIAEKGRKYSSDFDPLENCIEPMWNASRK